MLNWKKSDAQISSNPPEIPDGVYPARIESADFNASSSKGLAMWKFSIRLAGVKPLYYHNMLVEPTGKLTMPIIRNLAADLGVCFSIPEGSENESDWVGLVGIIGITHEITHKEYGGVSYPRAKFFTPAKGKIALANFKAKQAAKTQAQLEYEKFSSEFAGVDQNEQSPAQSASQNSNGFSFGDSFDIGENPFAPQDS